MAALTSIALGAAAAGALGGAIDGATDDPDQVTNTNSTSTRTLGIKTPEQQRLENQALGQYDQSISLADQLQGSAGSADQSQMLARALQEQILSGQGLSANQQEMQQINAYRDALVQEGLAPIQQQTDNRLRQNLQSAGTRNLRGQALAQLQGDATRAEADQLGALSRQANTIAAQQTMEAPYRRIAAQQQAAGQTLTLADQIRQQALANRQALSNPALLQMYNQNRQATGTTTQTGQQVTPGQEGSFLGAIGGALGGAGAGANLGSGIAANLRSGMPAAPGLKTGNSMTTTGGAYPSAFPTA